MRRRLDIAASIVVTPELLFLDEPTTGLDPRSRNQVWEIVRVLVAEGTTVLLTTQYLDEADQLADRIAIIDHGKVIAEGTQRRAQGARSARARCTCGCVDPDQRPDAEQRAAPRRSACRCTSSPTRPRCRRGVDDPERVAPRPGRAGHAPASPSPSSPSASPASTRCSSPSPATRPRTPTTRREDAA